MTFANIKNFKRGWFLGDFEPSLLRNTVFEVAVQYYQAGEVEAPHVHRIAREYTVVVQGRVRMNGRLIEAGTIVTIEPEEIADLEALDQTITLVIKTPSVPGDKYITRKGASC